MAIVNMTAPKMPLALHHHKHQHGGHMIFQVEILGGVRRTVQPMGAIECYTQTDGRTSVLYALF